METCSLRTETKLWYISKRAGEKYTPGNNRFDTFGRHTQDTYLYSWQLDNTRARWKAHRSQFRLTWHHKYITIAYFPSSRLAPVTATVFFRNQPNTYEKRVCVCVCSACPHASYSWLDRDDSDDENPYRPHGRNTHAIFKCRVSAFARCAILENLWLITVFTSILRSTTHSSTTAQHSGIRRKEYITIIFKLLIFIHISH